MKSTIVSSKELFDQKKNPTLCLSALRPNEMCVKCTIFQNARHPSKMIDGKWIKIRVGFDEAVKSLECIPNIPKAHEDLINEQDDLLDKANEFNTKAEEIDLKLDIR